MLTYYALAVLASVAVGLSKGGLPLIGTIAVPVLSLAIPPLEAAGLLLPIYVITDMFGLWFYRRDYDPTNLRILVPAALLGVFVGWATASVVTEEAVTLVVGVIGVAFCLNNWLRRRTALPPRGADVKRGLFWGAVSGFTSFVSHSGAPPYQVYVLPQRLEKMIYAGTTTILFAVVNAAKLIPYWALGQLSWSSLKAASLLLPAAVAATFAGVKLVRVLPERTFFLVVQVGLLIVSLKLTYDGAIALLR